MSNTHGKAPGTWLRGTSPVYWGRGKLPAGIPGGQWRLQACQPAWFPVISQEAV